MPCLSRSHSWKGWFCFFLRNRMVLAIRVNFDAHFVFSNSDQPKRHSIYLRNSYQATHFQAYNDLKFRWPRPDVDWALLEWHLIRSDCERYVALWSMTKRRRHDAEKGLLNACKSGITNCFLEDQRNCPLLGPVLPYPYFLPSSMDFILFMDPCQPSHAS